MRTVSARVRLLFCQDCQFRQFCRRYADSLEAFRDDADAIREFGADVVADLCRKLIAGGAPGIHFYTLNRARATLAVWQRLKP